MAESPTRLTETIGQWSVRYCHSHDVTVMTSAYDVNVMTNDGDNYVSSVTSLRPLRHQSQRRHCPWHGLALASGNRRIYRLATVRKRHARRTGR